VKVLMLSWEYPPHVVGGLGRHVEHLSQRLAALGEDVTVMTFTDGSSPSKEIVNNVNVIRVNPYSMRYPDFTAWVQGLNMLMVDAAAQVPDFDIIHAHDWLSAYAGIALKHMARKPLIATIHATEMGRRGTLHNDMERHIHEMEWWLAVEAWRIICCSNYMSKEIVSNFGCPFAKIEVIPNGFDPRFLNPVTIEPSAEGAQAISNDDPMKTALFVGRLVHEKGPHLLIKAAKILSRRDLRFNIVGEGAMKPYLEDLSRKSGLRGYVKFLGHVTDAKLSELYHQSFACVFPSLYEPFGIVALEAMSAGVPVVVSKTGGLDEIVEDGVNGLEFQPDSAESLANAIQSLLDEPTLCSKLVENGKASLRKYSWPIVAKKTLSIYRAIMEEYEKVSWKPSPARSR
jgi:glycogen(starch) synthase